MPGDLRRALRAHREVLRAAWRLRRRGFHAVAGPFLEPRGHGGAPLEAERWHRALETTCRLPWSTCLTRALALCALLREGGLAPALKLGVAWHGGEFHAHAWVEAAGAAFGRAGFEPLGGAERSTGLAPLR